MNSFRLTLFFLGLVAIVLLAALAAEGSNGMNMIGYGARSIAMGGADLAVTGTPSAMNINPAGIGRCQNPELDFALGIVNPSLSHRDQWGNDQKDVLDRYPIPFLGYVHPRDRFTFGLGVFVQGGMGAQFNDLQTPLGTDGTRTNLAHARVTPTLAWQALEGLSIGAGLNVSYVTAELAFFPETSVYRDQNQSGVVGDFPGERFFGIEAEDMSDVGYGLRLGFQYETGPVAFAGAYCTETTLNLGGGTLNWNLSALGLGKVAYDSEISKFQWPRQVGLGLAWRLSPAVLIAADVDWVDWSSAMQTMTIGFDSPDQAGAPLSEEFVMEMGWDDQWIWAAGVEVTPWRQWAIRAGYNHGETPIPDATLRPLFPAIAEDHVSGGVGFASGPWGFDAALEYVMESTKTNDNPDPAVNPFGVGYQASLSQLVGHFLVRHTF